MEKVINELLEALQKVRLEDNERQRIFELIEALNKEKAKQDFKRNRFIKDKSIAINLLNASISDMEKKNELIEEANKKLIEHQQIIEHKNLVLEMQKKRIQEQHHRLEDNLEKLTASYNELEQFTHIASHDLKSPLRTISNFGQLLDRRLKGQLDEESEEFLHFIINGAKQMNTVICDLLEFAHVGNKNKVETIFELSEVIEMIRFNLAYPIKESEATIIYDELPQMYGHRSSIIQLFQNLIGNAIKFRQEGVKPVINITCKDKRDYIYFEVSDNGVGIEEGYEHKVFQPFQRINNLDRPGSGMGLAICKKIVNQHGGEIYYKSERGKGTTFCFTTKKSQVNKNYHLANTETIS